MGKFLFIFFIFLGSYHIIAQDSLKTVIAEKGDGIYALLRKNGINPTKFYNAFIEVNKGLLSQDEFLKVGQSYFIPDTVNQLKKVEKVSLGSIKKYPIFGKEFARVDSLSNRLKDNIY